MEIDREQHLKLAKALNGEVWNLLAQADRTAAESRLMIHAAHASHYHWLRAGTVANEQRGEWLLARAYATAGLGHAALRHAKRCMELTEKHESELQDFDVAYAQEAVARAHAVVGNRVEAALYKKRARELGERIADPENRRVFVNDLADGDWRGVD